MNGIKQFPVWFLAILSMLGGGCLYGATFTLSKGLDPGAVEATIGARPRKAPGDVALYRTPPRRLYVVLGALEKTEADWADGNLVDALVGSLKQEAAGLGGDALLNVRFVDGVGDEPQARDPSSPDAIRPAPFTGLTATADVIMFVSADELEKLRSKSRPASGSAAPEPSASAP